MKIQCDNCAILHELDPPAWVVSSGRPFRFRCSSCGHSQSVMPDNLPEETPLPAQPQRPIRDPTPAPAPRIARNPPPTPAPESGDGAVFLKQNGQIYMVRDWETLKRWIGERRVDRHDLVSEGGVRWEPIGSRKDLNHLFGPTLAPHADDVEPDSVPAATGRSTPATLSPPSPMTKGPASPSPTSPRPASPQPTPPPNEPVHLGGDMPFGHEMPFMGASTGAVLQGAWHDDDTEGIPTGLPALPRQLGPNSRQRTGDTAHDEGAEEPEDAFGENPSYALPPPSTDPLADTPMGAVTSAGGMTYVAPDDDEPLPSPSQSDIPTAPPPALPVPPAFGNAPKGDEGWDPLMVGDNSESLRETPFSDVPTQSRRVEISEPSFVPEPKRRRERGLLAGIPMWGQFGLAFVVFAAFMLMVFFGLRDLVAPAPLPVPAPNPDAELGAVLDEEPKPTPVAPTAPDPEPAPEDQPSGGPDPEAVPDPDGAVQAVAVAPDPVEPEPAPAVAPAPPPAPEPRPASPPRPAPVVQPAAPPPRPAPREAAPAPRPTSLSALIRDGWSAMDSNPKAASDNFEAALDIYAAHAEANYGFGSAQLKLGNTGAAAEPLCTALARGSSKVRAEVTGLLQEHGLSCE